MPKHYTEKTWSETMQDLTIAFERWGVDDWQVEPARPPFGGAREYQPPDQRMVRLRYSKEGVDVELAIDKWPRAVDNLRALYLTVDALRLNEYRGISEAVRQAYAQLPAPAPEPVRRDPYVVLGANPEADMETIEALYRIRAKRLHPDAGGNPEAWKELQAAIEQIRRERT